jgi:hypothetical protein
MLAVIGKGLASSLPSRRKYEIYLQVKPRFDTTGASSAGHAPQKTNSWAGSHSQVQIDRKTSSLQLFSQLKTPRAPIVFADEQHA